MVRRRLPESESDWTWPQSIGPNPTLYKCDGDDAEVDRHVDLALNSLSSRPARRVPRFTLPEFGGHPAPGALVEGLLYRDSLATLAGEPGTYKSFVGVGLACAVATGQPFLGRETCAGPVLYIATEGAGWLPQRFDAALSRHTPGDRAPLLELQPEAVDLLDGDAVDELATYLWGFEPALVVIDTLSGCMGRGDENSSMDMSGAINSLARLQYGSSTCILVIHDPPKLSSKALRTSSHLLAAVDTSLRVSHKQIEVMKQKDHEPSGTIPFGTIPVGGSLVIVTPEEASRLPTVG